MRIVHVNDVAGVASTAVTQGRAEGQDWQLWPLPAVRGRALPVKVGRRAADLGRFWPVGRRADLVHVHYGLFAYYAWTVRRRYVLHLHGSDVRGNLVSRTLAPVVRRGIRRAGAVVYSTPDLAEAVHELRPDAVWVPAPVSARVLARPSARERRSPAGSVAGLPVEAPAGVTQADPITIVFASRWDPIKGLPELLDLARALRRELPRADLLGVDWGSGALQAAAAGVRLLPMMPAGAFHDLLASADVVVGQQATGALGVADLEAMALGRPLVARFTQQAAYGDEPLMWNTVTTDPVDAVRAVLADPGSAAARGELCRQWVLRHHSPAGFVARMLPIYRDIAPAAAARRRR